MTPYLSLGPLLATGFSSFEYGLIKFGGGHTEVTADISYKISRWNHHSICDDIPFLLVL